MRPRHIAAENGAWPVVPTRWPKGFNEAAAYSRGKRRGCAEDLNAIRVASMRPRHIAAENVDARVVLKVIDGLQ